MSKRKKVNYAEESSDEAEDFSPSEDEWCPNENESSETDAESGDEADGDFDAKTNAKMAKRKSNSSSAANSSQRKSNTKPKATVSTLRSRMFKKYRPSLPSSNKSLSQNISKILETSQYKGKKPIASSSSNRSSQPEPESDSESSGDEYLVKAEELDLRSSFFDVKTKENADDSAPEFDCNAGMKLSDSEDADEMEEVPDECSEDAKNATEDRPKSKLIANLNQQSAGQVNFHDLIKYTETMKENEEKFRKATNEAAKRSDDNLNVSKLLALGEGTSSSGAKSLSQPKSQGELRKDSKRKKAPAAADSDSDSDWEQVQDHSMSSQQHIIAENLQIDIPLPQAPGPKRKNSLEMELMIKRKLNRNLKEYQLQLHKVSLLCHIAHGLYCNRVLNNADLLRAALKLLPNKSCYPDGATCIKYFESFAKWYKSAIPIRKNQMYLDSMKHPRLGISLALQIEHKEALCKKYFILIFVILLRAMGFACRLVINLTPIPIKPSQSELHSLSVKSKDEQKSGHGKKSEDMQETSSKSEKKTKPAKPVESSEKKSKENRKQKEDAHKGKDQSKKHETDRKESEKSKPEPPKTVSKATNNSERRKHDSKSEENRSSKADIHSEKASGKGKQEADRKKSEKSKNDKIVTKTTDRSDSKKFDSKSKPQSKRSSGDETSANTLPVKQKSKKNSLPPIDEAEEAGPSQPKPRKETSSKPVQAVVLSEKPKPSLSTKLNKVTRTKRSGKEETEATAEKVQPILNSELPATLTKEPTLSQKFKKSSNKKGVLNVKIVLPNDKSEPQPSTSKQTNLSPAAAKKSDKIFIELPPKRMTRSRTKQQTPESNVIPQLDGADDLPRINLKSLNKSSKLSSDSDDDFVPSPPKRIRSTVTTAATKKSVSLKSRQVLSSSSDDDTKKNKTKTDFWVEVYAEKEEKWISINLFKMQVDNPDELRKSATAPVAYVFAWDNDNSLKDVSPRYCPQWNTATRKQRVERDWLQEAIEPYLGRRTRRSKAEDVEFHRMHLDKPLPTSIAEYKNHPLYALQRHILKFEAIYPPDAVTLGFVRGEPVYARDCVHTLHSREIWLKAARVVKPREQPYKIVKARPKWDKFTSTVIKDLPLELFGHWQTMDYDPPTAENGIVPRNAYGNVDLFKPTMLPKKTVLLHLPGLNRVCKKLKIDCAPAVVGFDFHQGACHPIIDGYVVCEEYGELVTDAWNREQEEAERKQDEKYYQRVYGNWKKLVRGLMIRERLKRKYNFKGLQVNEEAPKKKRKRK